MLQGAADGETAVLAPAFVVDSEGPLRLAMRLGERVRPRSVLSGRSVWLSVGGGLTRFATADLMGLADFRCVARHRPRTTGVT